VRTAEIEVALSNAGRHLPDDIAEARGIFERYNQRTHEYAAEPPESEEDTAASEDFEDAESASEALDEFTDVDPTEGDSTSELEFEESEDEAAATAIHRLVAAADLH
jgi:hypothetical protein